MTGRIVDLAIGLNGKNRVTIEVNEDIREEAEQLHDKLLDLTIKEHRQRRSLDANAYAWVLIGKIAEKLNTDPVEIYREAVRHIPGVYDIICIRERAASAFCDAWQKNGLAWMTEIQPSKIAGCVNVQYWYGSSTYDSKQMSALVDSLVQDAENIGIPTDTREYIDAVKGRWKDGKWCEMDQDRHRHLR